MLSVSNFSAFVNGVKIVNNVSFDLPSGELHVIMGPNGSGKSTLANALMGAPNIDTTGSVLLDGVNIVGVAPEERSKHGMFLAFQHPPELPGIRLFNLLRMRHENMGYEFNPSGVKSSLERNISAVGLSTDYLKRSINVGFSGGEKKRMELLQLIMLQPKVAILDEIDSGLDVDGLNMVVKVISHLLSNGTSILLITHYTRLLKLLNPDKLYVMDNGCFVKSGTHEIVDHLESVGFSGVLND